MTNEEAAVWFEARLKNIAMPGAREMHKMAISALRAREWISVEDRLPDESEYRDTETSDLIPLLVCVGGTEYPFRAMYDGKHWGDGWSVINVTHWMPLPEPPQKGE